MKALIFIMSDGSRFLSRVVPIDFDTQTWANSRADSLKFLEIMRVIEEVAA